VCPTHSQVNDIYRDLAQLVDEQGEHLDNIENNMTMTDERVDSGAKQLVKASKYQKQARTKSLWCLGISLAVLCVIFVMAFGIPHWSKKGGSPSAAADSTTTTTAPPVAPVVVSAAPTSAPTTTFAPTFAPTFSPTAAPTFAPTAAPTPSSAPTPSAAPTSSAPTYSAPTAAPT